MNKVMYEVNWHWNDEVFSHCTVTPITILRHGVLPGCSVPTITAKDKQGRVFSGSLSNYYETEEEAWESVKRSLVESIVGHEEQLAEAQARLSAQREYLAEIAERIAAFKAKCQPID